MNYPLSPFRENRRAGCSYSPFSVKGLFLLSFLIILFSCGEDRTYQYEELTDQAHLIQNTMQEKYLWGDSIKDLQWKEYFGSPVDFIKKLTSKSPEGDKWTYCRIDTLEQDEHVRGMFSHLNSYGLDLTLMTDPTGETTKQYARVLTVYPNSPAAECGIERGDFIAMIDGEKVAQKNLANLTKGREHKLVVNRLDVNEVDASLYWEVIDTLQMSPSRMVADEQIWVSRMVRTDMAYIMLTNLGDGHACDAVSQLLANHPRTLVVDLRLCNYGTIDEAYQLATILADRQGVVFQTIFNSRRTASNRTYQCNATNRKLRVCFITSNYTQGAAEWLIHGLRHLNAEGTVITYGTKTAGQNVWLEECTTDFPFTMYIAAAYVADAEGNYSYASGIQPDVEVNEFQYVQLFGYGTLNETVLSIIDGEN